MSLVSCRSSLELRAGAPDAGLAAPAPPPALTCGAGGPRGLSVSGGLDKLPTAESAQLHAGQGDAQPQVLVSVPSTPGASQTHSSPVGGRAPSERPSARSRLIDPK